MPSDAIGVKICCSAAKIVTVYHLLCVQLNQSVYNPIAFVTGALDQVMIMRLCILVAYVDYFLTKMTDFHQEILIDYPSLMWTELILLPYTCPILSLIYDISYRMLAMSEILVSLHLDKAQNSSHILTKSV